VVHVAGRDLGPDGFRRCLARLGGPRPYFVRANPSYAARLAASLLADGQAPVRLPVLVMTLAETLTPANEASIRAGLGCPVVNHYSAWEVPHMAQSCPDHPGLMHVNTERVVVRVVGDDGREVAPGQRGRVTITALANEVMPFINYDLGDFAVAGGPCPCGRGFPTLAALDGRGGELIHTPEGHVITPGLVTNHLTFGCEALGAISEYQVEQTALDAVTFRVVPRPGCTAPALAALRGSLERLVGPGVAVSVEAVEAIACEPSGKRLIIRSRLPPGAAG
jgi:phenylacetate-CoA ligase